MDFAARHLTGVSARATVENSSTPNFFFPPADPIKSRTRTDFSPRTDIFFDEEFEEPRIRRKTRRKNVTMLAGWFARDSRPAIRERKFLNGTYVPTYAHVRADEYLGTYVLGIRGPRCTLPPYRCGKKESFELNGTCRG